MKKLYKIKCSNCDKSLGTIFLEGEISELNRPQYLPFLLPDEVYEDDEVCALSINDDINSRIYCSDCADMKGKKMTNFEKFVNTFGFAPNTDNCLTDEPCGLCPIGDMGCTIEHKENWWASEYKENRE